MCNNELPNPSLVGPWTVHLNDAEVEVCGRCYLLTSILDKLKEIKDGDNR